MAGHSCNQYLEDVGRRIWSRPAWATYGELALAIVIIHNNNKHKADNECDWPQHTGHILYTLIRNDRLTVSPQDNRSYGRKQSHCIGESPLRSRSKLPSDPRCAAFSCPGVRSGEGYTSSMGLLPELQSLNPFLQNKVMQPPK